MFHADDISSIKIYKFILQKMQLGSVNVDPIYFAFDPNFECFAKVNAVTTCQRKS